MSVYWLNIFVYICLKIHFSLSSHRSVLLFVSVDHEELWGYCTLYGIAVLTVNMDSTRQ